jgi:hypothetical protein
MGAAAADLPGVARHGLCRCNEEADEIAAAPAAATERKMWGGKAQSA